tara:strand:- start:6729 stop:7805 length:1077 start_codon:yes stop_codon:yes gene_type:complete
MAIIRERIPLPGKLGKVFDIRLGLPREKDIDYAKRYRDMKPNENTRINKFRSLVSSAEGLARPNRFIAIVNLPSGLKGTLHPDQRGSEFAEYSAQSDATHKLNNTIRERLFFFCDSAQLPARNISDETKDQLYGPERKIARGHTWADLTLTFYMGQQMIEKMLFESWQNMAVNPFTFNANYYDEYIGSIELYPLVHLTNPNWEAWETDGGRKKGFKGLVQDTIEGVTGMKKEIRKQTRTGESRAMAIATVGAYYNHLVEAFPTNIAVQQMDYSTNNVLMKLSVDFSYRYARGPADIDARELGINEGALRPGKVSVEDWKARSRLEKLISGVGRDILNDVKRRFPWGRIFGGKIIPPFF